MSKRKRIAPELRRVEILNAAMKLATRKGGWGSLTRASIAVEAECSEALVSLYFGTSVQIKRAVMREAVRTENLPILAQGIVAGDKQAAKIDATLKQKAIQSLC